MTTTFGYPGIFVTEQLAPPPPVTNQYLNSPSTAAFTGEWWNGPSIPILCTSWNDFISWFGGFNPNPVPVLSTPYLGIAVYEFFSNGGTACWVYRVQNSTTSSQVAGQEFYDSEGGATPQATLVLTTGGLGVSGNAGSWGNNVYIDIVASNNNFGGVFRFNINIYYNPAGTGSGSQYLVESWLDLSMVVTDPRYVCTILNSSTTGSRWVWALDLSDPAGSPQNVPSPVTGVAFVGGSDGLSPAPSDYIATLTYDSNPSSPFDSIGGMLNFNLPGVFYDPSPYPGTAPAYTTNVINAAISYAENRPSTFLVIDPPQGQTPAGLAAELSELSPTNSSYCAIYYPWVSVANPASSNLLSTQTIPPCGPVLGQFANTDTVSGPWTAPAGTSTILQNVVSTERAFSPSDLTLLTSYNINPLRTQPNGQIVIWGTRTQNQGFATKFVPVRRTLDYVESRLTELLSYAVFAPNDAALWSSMTNTCNNFLSNLLAQGAFPSSVASSAYYVICNSTNNTPQTISQGIVTCEVGMALLYPSEFVSLVISQFQTGGTTVTSA